MIKSGPASRNKQPILAVLKPLLEQLRVTACGQLQVVEIASGTGEHAALFQSECPFASFLPTEPDVSMHPSIVAWNAGLPTFPPVAFDVTKFDGPELFPEPFRSVDAVVCINMIHISPFHCTSALFNFAQRMVRSQGFVLTYGPYRVGGQMVESNVIFDESLRSRNPAWGVRDLEEVEAVATQHEFRLETKVEMPANNLCVVFRRQ